MEVLKVKYKYFNIVLIYIAGVNVLSYFPLNNSCVVPSGKHQCSFLSKTQFIHLNNASKERKIKLIYCILYKSKSAHQRS